MTDKPWTKPGAYVAERSSEFDLALVDHAARRTRLVFDRVVAHLDRAHAERSLVRSRGRIATSIDEMTVAIGTDDLLRGILASVEPVDIAEALRGLCALVSGSPSLGGPSVELSLSGDVEISRAEPATAWAIVVAAVEMLEETTSGMGSRLDVDLGRGRLLVTAVGIVADPALARKASGRSAFLDRLAGLLGAGVERRRIGRRSIARLTVPTRRAGSIDGDGR